MSSSATVMPANSPDTPVTPLILERLPNPPLSSNICPRKTKMHIDLILLAIEALDLGGGEAMLIIAKQLELEEIIKDRVKLWQLRASNHLRRAHNRRDLTLIEAKALVVMIGYLTKRLTVTLRQYLLIYQQLSAKQLPAESDYRLSEYLERFRAHFRARMNPRRTMIAIYKDDEKLDKLAMDLLGQLLFCTGTSGMLRLWSSLFDGEVE
jgi:Protein of unknown function (DUF3038)